MIELLFPLQAYQDLGLLALRLTVGAIFLVHGTQKWAMWKMAPSAQMPANMLGLMKFLSVAEPLGGLAMVVGFLVQPAAIGLGLIMIGASMMKMKTWKIPFAAKDKTGWEFDILILAACLALLFFGAGAIALDRLVF